MATAGNKMNLTEVDGDLFTAPETHSLAHYVGDFAMAGGFKVKFKQVYGKVDELLAHKIKTGGVAVLKDKNRFIYYLVTKPQSYGSPTYDSLRSSLSQMREHMLAIPRIGCGIDGLEWDKVTAELNTVFGPEDIEIVVYNFVPNYNKGMCTKVPKCELDYYAVLNVPRDATKEQITLAYRRLAIHCNPHREEQYDKDFIPNSWLGDISHLESLKRERQWAYINMAFDILSHPLRREIYDRFGEAGLLQGCPLPNGYFPPYEYHGDHLKVYHSVFGSYSPFANLIDIVTDPPLLYSNKDGLGVRVKDPPVEKVINLDLKEIFFGTMKRMKILRQEYVDDLKTITDTQEKTLLVNIPAGTLAGTKFIFPSEGDRCPTTIPADIIFIAADKPHEVYVRSDNDLIYTHPISLCEALVGFRFSLCTVDDRKLVILNTDVVHQTYEKIIKGEGMPKLEVEGEEPQKGDLIIRFQTTYPPVVPRELKCKVKMLFDEIAEVNKKNEQSTKKK